MKKNVVRAFSRIISLMLVCICLFSSCSKKKDDIVRESFLEETRAVCSETERHTFSESDVELVEKNDFYSLGIDKKTSSPCISGKDGKVIFTAIPEDENSTATVLSLKILKDGVIFTVNSQDDATFTTKKGDSGVTVEYTFDVKGEKLVLPMRYTLENTRFDCELDFSKIESDSLKILSVDFLPFFACSSEAVSGDFILVPDSSGAVIHLDSEKRHANAYKFDCYGADKFVSDSSNPEAKIAAFGMKTKNNSFACIALRGDCISHVTATTKSDNDYNRAYFSFNTTEYKIDDSKKEIYTHKSFGDKIEVCYRLLSGSRTGYDSMAAAAREEMIRCGYIPNECDDDTDFLLNVTGSNDGDILSSFEQTEEMIDLLKGKGIGSFALRYSGALGGGVRQKNLYSTSVSRKQGGKSGLEKLSDYAEKSGVSFYLDTDICSSSSSYAALDGAESIDNARMSVLLRDYMWFDIGNSTRLSSRVGSDISVKSTANQNIGLYAKNEFYEQRLQNLSDFYEKSALFTDSEIFKSVRGLCINDASGLLYSSADIDRTTSRNMLVSRLKSMSNEKNIMLDNPNIFCVSSSDTVTNMKFDTDYISDDTYEPVPFLPIVYHGSVNYTSRAIDAGDPLYKYETLRCLEYGSIPSIRFVFSDKSIFYYGYYADQEKMSEIVKIYKKSQSLLSDLKNKQIVSHRKIDRNSDGESISSVFCTEYSNGSRIYVNYSPITVTTSDNIVVSGLNAVRIN